MSISEIAKHLNVSKSTVSLVINGKAEQGRISSVLAKRILDYVDQIGYKPNALAKGLATGKSHSIGLIVENIGDSFFGPIALYIEEYLRNFDYKVFYSSTMGDDKQAADILKSMLEKKVEGIILAPTLHLEKSVNIIIESGIPLVIFDRKIPDIETNYVGTNNYEASLEAVTHLVQMKYKNIGMVTIDSNQPQMNDRLLAYQDLLVKEGKSPAILRIPFSTYKTDATQHIEQWLKANPELDALYFSTNYLCIAGLKSIQRLNRKKAFGIIAFDDHEVFDLLQPTISCVKQPLQEIAKAIVEMLLKSLNESKNEPVQVVIPSLLTFRGSTKKK